MAWLTSALDSTTSANNPFDTDIRINAARTHRITRLAAISAIFTITLATGGCAGLAAINTATHTAIASANNISQREYHQAIDLSGRLSVRYQQDDKEQIIHGNFTWSQTSDHTIVRVLSPLGQTLANIEITPQQSTLHQADQPARNATDVDLLTVQTLGWPLPISSLRHWLQGFGVDANGKHFNLSPASNSAVNNITTADHWLLQYTDWQTTDGAAGVTNSYPKRIDLTRNTKQAGQVVIRIVIDSVQSH
ncbi:MAG: outer membrane lipoprotein LolB [Glaciimonas sp.]|nr:outer membrane lipoprotein LolB [Glaciimonas sp.]